MPPTNSMEKPPPVERRAARSLSSPTATLGCQSVSARLAPTPATKPRLIRFDESLASELGVNAQGLEPDELAAVFAGNVTPPGASRSRWPTPGISSGVSILSLATAALSSSARSWTATASGAMSN